MNFKTLIVLILTIALILSSVAFTFGQEDGVTIRDLGIEHTGLLPSNPFYFTKEWKRGIRSLFSFSPIKKIGADLEVANEKIAELKQLANRGLDTATRRENILRDYHDILQQMTERIISLSEEVRAGEDGKRILQDVLAKGILHDQLLREFLQEHEIQSGENTVAVFTDIERLIQETIDALPEPADISNSILDIPDAYRYSIARTILLFRLAGQAQSEVARRALGTIKDTLALRLEGEFAAGKITEEYITDVLHTFPNAQLSVIQALDEIREHVATSEFRTAIGRVRDALFEEPAVRISLTRDTTMEALQAAEDIFKNLEVIKAEKSGPYITSLREKAQFNIEQARISFERGNFEIAFGQASTARAAAQTALDALHKNTNDIEHAINVLKQQYDALNERIRAEKGLLVFKDTLMTVEKEIVALSQYGVEKIKDLILPLRDAALHLETLYIQLGQ